MVVDTAGKATRMEGFMDGGALATTRKGKVTVRSTGKPTTTTVKLRFYAHSTQLASKRAIQRPVQVTNGGGR